MDCDCGWFLETSLLQWLMLLSRCLRSFLAHFRRSADLKKTFQSSQGGAFCNSNGRKCLPSAGGWTLVLVFFLHQSFLHLGNVSCICKVHWEISTRHLRNCDPVHEQKLARLFAIWRALSLLKQLQQLKKLGQGAKGGQGKDLALCGCYLEHKTNFPLQCVSVNTFCEAHRVAGLLCYSHACRTCHHARQCQRCHSHCHNQWRDAKLLGRGQVGLVNSPTSKQWLLCASRVLEPILFPPACESPRKPLQLTHI